MKVIEVENISKCYKLGTIGSGSLKTDLAHLWSKISRKNHNSEVDFISNKNEKEYLALKDVSFSVEQGDVLGLIGKNGAGKSTLLKILSRITLPSSGLIKIRGRVASLLEVGTGFHPELTGRENIFLNGAILGMTKNEIKSKLDEIIFFSGVEKFIDTPVKRYSSGMYVRLAFAVAAHLEPEILIVDEVLAVGDAEFQKKCLGKMKDVSSQGRTVLFVSHNLGAVRNLCNKGIYLEKGSLLFQGEVNEAVDRYLTNNETNLAVGIFKAKQEEEGEVVVQSVKLLNSENKITDTFDTSMPIKIEIEYEAKEDITGSRLNFQLLDSSDNIAFSSSTHSKEPLRKEKGVYSSVCHIPSGLLNGGQYKIMLQMGIPGVKVLLPGRVYLKFHTVLTGNNGTFYNETWPGILAPYIEWEVEKK